MPFALNVSLNLSNVWKVARKRKRLNGSVVSLNCYVYVRPFIHSLYFINIRSYVKIRRQWKSTFSRVAVIVVRTFPNILMGEGTNLE